MRLIAVLRDTLESWLDLERERLAVWLPVFMGAGVLGYFALRFEPAVWVGAAVAVPMLGLAVLLPVWRWLLGPVAAVALGFASGQMATYRMPPIEVDLPTHATIVTGTIRAVEALPEGRRITIEPAWLDGAAEPLRRTVRLRLQKKDQGGLSAGDGVRIRALVRPPAPPSYPGGWDLQRDAFYAGLGGSGYALGKAERISEAVPSGAMRFVQWLREVIAHRVTAVIPGAAGAVSVTLLTGASMAIPEVDHAAFRDSGLAHLLAVAGLHIGIVMGFALTLSRLGFAVSERASLFWPTKKLAAFCALGAGGVYMVLTGMHLPIMRSFVMACLLTVALMADRKPFSLRGLALAGIVLMLVSPQEVPNVSFQMSFSAVLALIAGYEAMRPWLLRLHGKSFGRRIGSHVVALALTSALAGSASAPFGAYHFGRVQVYFVLANMVAVPLTAMWVMPAGLIALALMPLHLEALALVPMGWGAELVLWVARATAALPVATFEVPHIPAWGLCVFSFGLAWLGLWQTRRRLGGIVLMLVGLASPLADRPPDLLISADGRLIAVRTPQGAFLQQAQGGSKFTRDAWAQYWAVGSFQTLPKVGDDPGAVRCLPDACLLRPYPDRPGRCWCGGLCIRSFATSPRLSCRPNRRGGCARGLGPCWWIVSLCGGMAARRFGWIGGGARMLTDRTERGDRPWVPLPPVARKVVPTLPPAAIDRPARVALPSAAVDRPVVVDRVGDQAGPVPDLPPPDIGTGE